MSVQRRHASRLLLTGLVLAGACLTLTPVRAAVSDVTFTDVTPHALAVIWASDEPVTTATVRVFADAAGTTELTGGLSLSLASQAHPPALTSGIVKVDVAGLAADTCVYLQTETTGTATVTWPASPPFAEVCTAASATRVSATNGPLVNDLILHDVFAADGVTPASGALLLVSAPGVGEYPLSAFVGEGYAEPAAVVDLTNLFDPGTGATVEVAEGTVLELTEFRGLLCPSLSGHRSVRYRRAPDFDEVPGVGSRITELESPVPCFFADTLCDDTIDILDAQRVLNAFGSVSGECAFNGDFDIVADQAINVLDLQSVLNRFGESAPFSP